MASIINASTSTGLVTTADTSGVLQLQTGGTAAVTVDASQNVTMAGKTTNPTTISVGNATPSASGAGITFPAALNASSDANTLDDYEEGVWTPLQGAGLTVVGTYSSSGRYTKIGRVVSISAYISASTSVACTGNGQICTGLPFTPASGENPAPMIVDPRNFSNSGSALPSGAVQNSTAISAVTGFSFSCTYFV